MHAAISLMPALFELEAGTRTPYDIFLRVVFLYNNQ